MCWGEQPRKSYSLPHRYKACRALPQDNVALAEPAVKPSEFKQQFMSMRQWFNRFSDEQKNMVLAELLVSKEFVFLLLSFLLFEIYCSLKNSEALYQDEKCLYRKLGSSCC